MNASIPIRGFLINEHIFAAVSNANNNTKVMYSICGLAEIFHPPIPYKFPKMVVAAMRIKQGMLMIVLLTRHAPGG